MDMLCDDILTKIFQRLPSRCRRSVRLVCRRWNQVSKNYTFIKDEWIVLADKYTLTAVAPYCECDERKVFNLRFVRQHIKWNDIELSFWNKCGERVESLDFENAHFNIHELISIIKFCTNLKRIKISYSFATRNLLRQFLDDFDYFVNLDYFAPSVTAFCFLINFSSGSGSADTSLTNYKLQKIFATFPNLTDLKLTLKYVYICPNGDGGTRELESNTNLTYPGITKILSGYAEYLEKLSLELEFFSSLPIRCRSIRLRSQAPVNRNPLVITEILPRFKNIRQLELSDNVKFTNPLQRPPCCNLLQLTKITALKLSLACIRDSVEDFIALVLNAFSNLCHLSLNNIATIKFNELLIEKLLVSTLESLELFIFDLCVDPYIQDFRYFSTNRTLTKMAVSRQKSRFKQYSRLLSVFFQHLKNLTDLAVYYPTDEILQTIFKHHEHLRRLRLEHCITCTDFGFTGISDSPEPLEAETTYCINELSNLEYLRILPVEKLTEKTFYCFVFPKLRTLELYQFNHKLLSLYLYREPKRYLAKFEMLIENSQLLEKLKLSCSERIPQKELEEILQAFGHLRSVNIQGPKTVTKYNYENFFEICPSLRSFVDNKNYYFFDILTKKIEPYKA